MKRILVLVLLVMLSGVIAMAAVCSPDGEDVDVDITIDHSADNLFLDKDTTTVPASATASIVFGDEEDLLHNFLLFDKRDLGPAYFIGYLITKGTITCVFMAPDEPEINFFLCDLHSVVMIGDLIVSPEDQGQPQTDAFIGFPAPVIQSRGWMQPHFESQPSLDVDLSHHHQFYEYPQANHGQYRNMLNPD